MSCVSVRERPSVGSDGEGLQQSFPVVFFSRDVSFYSAFLFCLFLFMYVWRCFCDVNAFERWWCEGNRHSCDGDRSDRGGHG